MIRRIDISSIKPNPNAGRDTFLVPGKITPDVDENGKVISWSRPVTVMRTLYPEGSWLYEYEPLEVTCEYCEAKFSADDLDEDWDDVGDESFHYPRICPKCKAPDCCEEIDLETIGEALERKKANENHSS